MLNKLDIKQIYLIAICVYIFLIIYYAFIPMDKLTKYYNLAARFRDKYEQYDWHETVRRQKIYNISCVAYLSLFLFLSKNIGEVIAIYGVLVFFVLSILFAIWIGPVKKK